MKETDAVKEAKAILDAQTGPVDMEWNIQALMSAHDRIEGEDKDFALLAEYVACQRWFKLARRRKAVVSDDEEGQEEARGHEQMVLPGYEYLQETYAVTREGRQQSVPIEQMTVEEIKDKAQEYRRIGKGNFQHAEELERYAAERETR